MCYVIQLVSSEEELTEVTCNHCLDPLETSLSAGDTVLQLRQSVVCTHERCEVALCTGGCMHRVPVYVHEVL